MSFSGLARSLSHRRFQISADAIGAKVLGLAGSIRLAEQTHNEMAVTDDVPRVFDQLDAICAELNQTHGFAARFKSYLTTPDQMTANNYPIILYNHESPPQDPKCNDNAKSIELSVGITLNRQDSEAVLMPTVRQVKQYFTDHPTIEELPVESAVYMRDVLQRRQLTQSKPFALNVWTNELIENAFALVVEDVYRQHP